MVFRRWHINNTIGISHINHSLHASKRNIQNAKSVLIDCHTPVEYPGHGTHVKVYDGAYVARVYAGLPISKKYISKAVISQH